MELFSLVTQCDTTDARARLFYLFLSIFFVAVLIVEAFVILFGHAKITLRRNKQKYVSFYFKNYQNSLFQGYGRIGRRKQNVSDDESSTSNSEIPSHTPTAASESGDPPCPCLCNRCRAVPLWPLRSPGDSDVHVLQTSQHREKHPSNFVLHFATPHSFPFRCRNQFES